MRPKILFWLALATAVMGVHSAEGNLFYFFSVHLSMAMIGFLLHRREMKGRMTARAGAPSSKAPVKARNPQST
jgi:hypothetical protein